MRAATVLPETDEQGGLRVVNRETAPRSAAGAASARSDGEPTGAPVMIVTSALHATGGIPSYSRAVLDALNAAGPTVVVELELNGDRRQAVREFARVMKAILSIRPAALILTNISLSPVGLIARWLGIPFASVLYGIEVWGPRSPVTAAGCRCATQLWSISEFTAGQAVERYSASRTKIRVLGGSLDDGLFELERRRQSVFTILTVSRLENLAYKGIDTCLAATRSVALRLPCRYVIVGDGPALSELQAKVSDAGLGEIVDVVGLLDERELHAQMEAADVVVLCSRFREGQEPWGEGLGLVLLEGAASGTAGIGSEKGGTAETVVDGVTGYLVPAGDPERLAEILLRLGTDREHCEALGDNARAWASQHHSRAAFRARVRTALDDLRTVRPWWRLLSGWRAHP